MLKQGSDLENLIYEYRRENHVCTAFVARRERFK